MTFRFFFMIKALLRNNLPIMILVNRWVYRSYADLLIYLLTILQFCKFLLWNRTMKLLVISKIYFLCFRCSFIINLVSIVKENISTNYSHLFKTYVPLIISVKLCKKILASHWNWTIEKKKRLLTLQNYKYW